MHLPDTVRGTFRPAYEQLLMAISRRGHRELNERTGTHVLVGDPTSFTIDLSSEYLPVCGIRRTFPRTAAAEVAWFLLGRKDVGFIKQYAPIWDKFVEDDGVTVAGAYGHRWRNHFGRDQVHDAILALTANPSDRRVFISAWDPAIDGLGRPSKNVPCPVGFTLSITDGRLNSTLLIRSSDTFVGLPYDVMGHALLMQAIRYSLVEAGLTDLQLGRMHVTLAHPHLYEVHLEMLNEAFKSQTSDDTFLMPTWSVERIVQLPERYVQEVYAAGQVCRKPEYHCRPDLIL